MKKETGRLRVAVIGTGNMGQNHLRVYSTLKNVDLVGLYDVDIEKAQKQAAQYGCKAYDDLECIAKDVDGVSICSPSTLHVEHGLFFLNKGIDCLIEKPLATTEEDCIALIAAAESSDATLMVGHIERFNPAVKLVGEILKSGNHKIYGIDANRMSMVSNRITDVDVIADLMVHDLDIILSLLDSPPIEVIGNGVAASQDFVHPDYVNALLTFEGGVVANVTASRITQNKVRELKISADIGYITIDYINQDFQIYKQEREASQRVSNAYVMDIALERALIRRVEPLKEELENFVQATLGHGEPLVTGLHGLNALLLVQKIQETVRSK